MVAWWFVRGLVIGRWHEGVTVGGGDSRGRYRQHDQWPARTGPLLLSCQTSRLEKEPPRRLNNKWYRLFSSQINIDCTERFSSSDFSCSLYFVVALAYTAIQLIASNWLCRWGMSVGLPLRMPGRCHMRRWPVLQWQHGSLPHATRGPRSLY